MLNRYGLFDIEKFLREQDEPPGPAAGPQPAGGAPSDPAAPPAAPPEDPDEKIDKAREKNQDADLVDFRKQHADVIYQIAHTSDNAEQGFYRNADLRSLRQKFDTSGADKPFFILFDPTTSGVDGKQHLSLIASLHHEGKVSGDRVKFHSAGDASSFAEGAATIRDDLTFAVDEQDKTAVRFASAEAQPSQQPAGPV